MDYTKLDSGSIVGLDLSLTGTGYCKIGVSSPQSGVINTAKLGEFERLRYIRNEVMRIVEGDSFVVMENFSYASKGAAIYQIAGLAYLVRYALWERCIPFATVAPVTLKKFITGTAKAEKNVVLREVWRKYQVEAADDNEADAVVLAHIGCCLVGVESPANKAQREVMHTLTQEKKTKRKLNQAA